MNHDTPWYKTFFGEDYLRLYEPLLPPARTEWEVKGIVKLMNLAPGSRILDLCCGHGRHAIRLAQQGYQVTGQDLSEIFLQRAQAAAEALGVVVRWVHGDMRDIPFENEFDGVLNIFTAFGYLENDDEDQKVLQQVHKALKPGGLFLQEVLQREALLLQYRPHAITHLKDGLIALEEQSFDLLTSRNSVQVSMLYPDGRRTEYHHTARIYTLTELVRMLRAAGLQLEAAYGGLDASPLTLDTHRLVTLNRRV